MDIKKVEKAMEYEHSNRVNADKPHKMTIGEMFKGLKWYEVIVACWPIVLIGVGGAIGGALGGLTCALNFKIFKSKISKPLKYVYSVLTGIGAIVLYIVIVALLMAAFPGIFNKNS